MPAHLRPQAKSPLPRRAICQIKALFGTPKHALAVLGLDGVVEYAVFYRALNGAPIPTAVCSTIQKARARWLKVYMKENWDAASAFSLPLFEENDESYRALEPPPWTPDH